MPSKQHSSPVALTYARSLIELASEQKQAEAVGAEMAAIQQIVQENPSFQSVLRDPAISKAERDGLVDKIFRGRVSQLVLNFLGVLGEKGRLGIIDQIAAAYDDLLNEMLGKVEVDATAAQKLTPEQFEIIRKRVGEALGKQVVLNVFVDESIIGGLVLRVGDQLIDASVKHQLKAIREQLLAARPK